MKKCSSLALIFTLAFTAGFAQQETLPLWPDEIPNSRESDEKELEGEDDIRWISQVQEPNIAVFLPPKRMATGQAVVICPGGGYQGLAYDWEGTEIAKWLNSKGIAGIVLKYRLPNSKSVVTSSKAPLQDAQRAMRLVRSNSQAWNIDKEQIGIMGFSAGGHLASTLGTQFSREMYAPVDEIDTEEVRPNFMVLVYPVITMDPEVTHMGSHDALLGKNPAKELETRFSSEKQVTSSTPPTFIVHAGDDGGVPVENSLRMYKALNSNNVPVEMHIYPTGGHGFSLAVGKYYLQEWPGLLHNWLQHLKEE